MIFFKKFLLLIGFIAITGCSHKSSQVHSNAKPLVMVSVAPYRFLAERIAGPGFDVGTVVPAASNPHSFEPTSAQVTDMARCNIWFRIGEPFEQKIIPILQSHNRELTVVDLRDGIELLEEGSLSCKSCGMDHFDRHIWLSPKLAQKQAKLIEKILSERYPEQRDLFQQNCNQLIQDLIELDLEIRNTLKHVGKRTVLVSHPAFAYFCKDFDLVQLSVEYEGKDPRPKHLEETLKMAIEHSAEVALALPQYNNKGAQLIAEKLHKPVRFIDPYSADYFENMRKLAKLIADPYAN